MFSLFYKKALSILLIVSFVVPSALFIAPKKVDADASCAVAYIASLLHLGTAAATPAVTAVAANTALLATVPPLIAASAVGFPAGWTGGGGLLGVLIGTNVSNGVISASGLTPAVASGAANSSMSFATCILKPLAIILGKAMLRNITNSIVTWINSGFHGQPSFVQDFGGLITDTTDQVLGNFIDRTLGLGFLCNNFSLQIRIALAQSALPYEQRARCTLSQIQQNVNGFIQGDNNGGWSNWLSVTTEPQNNIYGATIIAQNELSQRIAKKLDIQNRVLDWGKGFRSWEVCTVVRDPVTGMNTGEDKKMSPTDPNCVQHETRTPGTVIENQLALQLGSGVRQLEIAQDIEAIVGALANQLMSQVITGAAGLLGAGKNSASTYQSALSQKADPGLSKALDSGVTSLSAGTGFDTLLNPNDTPTNTSATPSNANVDVIQWDTMKAANNVTLSSPLVYGISLKGPDTVSGLTITTTLKKDGQSIPFLTAFSTLELSYGRTDGSASYQSVTSKTDAGAAWSGVSIDKNTQFLLGYYGPKNTNAPIGTYTIETSARDSNNNIVVATSTSFLILPQ